MAIGDKLYLADKPTLDTVKNSTDIIKSDTTIIKRDLANNTDRIINALGSSSSSDYFLPSEINNSKLKYEMQTVNTSQRNYVNQTGVSGELYGVIYISSNYINSTVGTDIINVVLDGVTVYASTFTHYTTDTYGLLTSSMIISSINYPVVFLPSSPPVAVNKSLATNPVAAANNIVYLPKPIRFSNSIQISASLSTTTNLSEYGKLYYMYKLD